MAVDRTIPPNGPLGPPIFAGSKWRERGARASGAKQHVIASGAKQHVIANEVKQHVIANEVKQHVIANEVKQHVIANEVKQSAGRDADCFGGNRLAMTLTGHEPRSNP